MRISNKDYLNVFTPFFRVHEMDARPTETERHVRRLLLQPRPPDKLIQMFILKGVLSEAEGRALDQR